MSSSQSNKLGQIYVEWDIKTEILRYVSACSVARNSNCPMYTLCSGVCLLSVNNVSSAKAQCAGNLTIVQQKRKHTVLQVSFHLMNQKLNQYH